MGIYCVIYGVITGVGWILSGVMYGVINGAGVGVSMKIVVVDSS